MINSDITLQLLAGHHQTSDAANISRPPDDRAQVAQARRLNV